MISEKAKKLGEALVAAKILTAEQLKKAMVSANKGKAPSLIIGLFEEGFLSYQIFEKFVAQTMGIRSAIIENLPAVPGLLTKVGVNVIKERRVFPIVTKDTPKGTTLALGMVDPTDQETMDGIQATTGYRVVPVLISLPDFKATFSKVFNQAQTVDLGTAVTEEKVVLIRPGGYEEEIAFQNKQSEKTKTALTKPTGGLRNEATNSRGEIDINESPAPGRSAFVGRNEKKFREEILAKLELSGTDANVLKKETYTREVLHNDLGEVSNKPLDRIYGQIGSAFKVEAVINALIKNGVLTKRDIITSAAVSFIFGDEKER